MAGHSKWANIRHKKAKEDAKRGKIFTTLGKEIAIAAKLGGGDPAGNPRLRTLLEKAREVNMPLDNAQRAIKRGTGELPGASYESIMYEGYGPGGIAVLIDTLTDNKNRTVAELRHLFSSKGGTLAETGAVGWMFAKSGVLNATGSNLSEDSLLELLIDFDISDISHHEATFTIVCEPKSLDAVKQALLGAGIKVESAELEWVASNTTSVAKDLEEKAVEFLAMLEDLDDVKHVFTNLG